MSRYKNLFNQMLAENKDLFDEFEILHNANPRNKLKFNEVGYKVQEVIRIFIDDLCRTSESSGFGNYTSNLSDLFMKEVRTKFPDIDDIGIE